MTLYGLIMAGGSGTRLWPRSRTERPKQFLDLTSSATMLQEAQERLIPLIPPERVIVATNKDYVDLVRQQLPSVPHANVLGEPQGRGTAAAIGLAAIHLRQRDPEATMAVLTADHLIKETDTFRRVLHAAAAVASEGWLVTLGIRPEYPETGYGYIERGEGIQASEGFDIFRVARFAEKPDHTTAEAFVASGMYDWNSGMFIWRVDTILAEIERQMPELYEGLREIEQSLGTTDAMPVMRRVWPRLPNQTIDYGIMEKAQRVAVIPVEIGWNDVGSWAAVYDVLPHDAEHNAVVGTHLGIDTRSSLIYSPKRMIATIGMEDVIVVDTDDVVLVCPRERSQDVKHLVSMLKQQERAVLRPAVADEIRRLTSDEVRRLFEAADIAERALLSLLLHAGLSPDAVVRLGVGDVDLERGWIVSSGSRHPLPDRTIQFIASWLPVSSGGTMLFPQWTDPSMVEAALREIGERAGAAMTSAHARRTLAQTLFDNSEEGHIIRRVLGDEVVLARVPLETQFPFSMGDWSGQEDGDLARRARDVLNHAAALLDT